MKKHHLLFIILTCATALHAEHARVNIPVTTVMATPKQRGSSYQHHHQQATQLLLGDRVTTHRTKHGMTEIRALDQKVFYNNKWGFLVGWVPSNALHITPDTSTPHPELMVVQHSAPLRLLNKQTITVPFGAHFSAYAKRDEHWLVTLPDGRKGLLPAKAATVAVTPPALATTQALLVNRGLQFLGDPYVWGGGSPHNPTWPGVSGTDCSSLMYLLYRSVGITLPRNAHSQHEKSVKRNHGRNLQVGDLVFLYYESTKHPGRFSNMIGHVLMYIGDDKLLENEGNVGGNVRVVRSTQRFGKPLKSIASNEIVQNFRTFARGPLGNKKTIAHSPDGKARVVLGSYL